MREKLKRLALPLATAVLALLCLVCLIIYSALADSLDSQHQAERWQGDGQLEFSQLSCFMSVDQKLTLDQVYSFRKTMMDKFHEAALDIDNDAQLFCDAWSTTGKAYVVQLGALKNADKVNEIVGKLRGAGYRVYTSPSTPVQGKITRILVGPDASKDKLKGSLGELKQLSGLSGVVMGYTPN